VEIEAATVIARGDDLLARAPALRRIELVGLVADVTDPRVEPGTSPQLALVRDTTARALATLAVRHTRELGLSRIGVIYQTRRTPTALAPAFWDVLPEVVAHLRASGQLARLRGLALPMISRELLDRLAVDVHLADLDTFEIAGCLDYRLSSLHTAPLAPRRLVVGRRAPVAYHDLGGVTRRATDLGPILGLAELPEPAREQLRALRVAWHQKTARRALSTDSAFSGLRELTVVDSHVIDPESLAPLLHARYVRPRVLGIDAPVHADTIRAIAASPLGSVVEVIDLRGSHEHHNRDVDPSAFDGIVLRT